MKFDIECLEQTGSTNDDARQAAESGADEGKVFWALQQSSGRGRQGRQWQSPVGNLYFSVLMRPQGLSRNYWQFSFIAALAIREAIQKILPKTPVELKWPNDVLVKDKKISGVLLEAGEGWLVIGMGINVRHVPEVSLYPVTSLNLETGQDVDLAQLLHSVLEALKVWTELLGKEGFASIRKTWLASARKGAMRVRLPKGDEVHGDFVDLDESGNLHLQLADGTHYSVNTGDVFF